MTVSDIAREAGVGKGTVYGYFTTKEELIAKALSYNLHATIEQVLEKLRQMEGFDVKLRFLLATLDEITPCRHPLADAFFMIGPTAVMQQHEQDMHEFIQPLLQRVRENLLEAAVQEGLLPDGESLRHVDVAMMEILTGFCLLAHAPWLVDASDAKTRQDVTVQMVYSVLASLQG